MQKSAEAGKKNPGSRTRSYLGELRVGFALADILIKNYGIGILTRKRDKIPVPTPSAIGETLGMSRSAVWRISCRLAAEGILRVTGDGRATSHTLRSPQKLLHWLRQRFRQYSTHRVYVSYALPNSMRALSRADKILKMTRRAAKYDVTDEFALCLHSALQLTSASAVVYHGDEIEIMATMNKREEIEAALGLSPIASFPGAGHIRGSKASSNVPSRIAGDLVAVYHDTSDLLIAEQSFKTGDIRVLSAVANFLELEIYPRRGLEAAKRIQSIWQNSPISSGMAKVQSP